MHIDKVNRLPCHINQCLFHHSCKDHIPTSEAWNPMVMSTPTAAPRRYSQPGSDEIGMKWYFFGSSEHDLNRNDRFWYVQFWILVWCTSFLWIHTSPVLLYHHVQSLSYHIYNKWSQNAKHGFPNPTGPRWFSFVEWDLIQHILAIWPQS